VRRFLLCVLLIVSSAAVGAGLTPSAQAASVGLSDPQTGRIVSDDPVGFTPHALNGTVYSIVQVGDYVVVGGSFTQVRQTANSTTITRNRIFAFNATTGQINPDFNPGPNGTVYKVQQSADPGYVYVGGGFTSAAGATRRNLFKIRVSDGQVDTSFRPANIDGQVRDLEVVGNRLFVAGKFTHLGGNTQRALGTLNATTGAYDPYFTGVMAGWHRDHTRYPGDVTSVLSITTDPQNTQLVAGGNFTSVNGQARSQIAKFDISAASSYALSPWYTNLFTQACQANFETYLTDVEYSPNGAFFVVTTAGAYGGSAGSNAGTSGCDVVARFETGGTSGPTAATWTAYSGGDSTWTAEVTDNVVYVGGHQKFQNNPNGSNVAGQGAVARPGIAALNTVNGIPYSWNPTRTRGVGVQDMLATPQGLYVGSDTDRIGNYEYHARIAMLPLAGGDVLPPMANPTLPGTVYSVGTGGSQLSRRSFDGSTASSPASAPNGSAPWGSSVGAFMSNGVLYTATSSGVLTRRTFDGSTYGPASTVETADEEVFQSIWHGTDMPTMTSLFFLNGQMYITRSGQTMLFRRGFEPESDIVGQQRFSTGNVAGINFANVRGAFVASNQFYWADTTGRLFRAAWSGHGPVGGTSVQVSGPGVDGQNWSSRSLFVFQAAGQQTDLPPIADADIDCTGLTCSFDSTDSSDPDGGSIQSVLWQFGDTVNNTSTAPQDSHTYGASGPRTVTLTVTDDEGSSSTITRNINPQEPVDTPPTANIASSTCDLLACSFTSTGSGDTQGPITYLWEFGDGDSSTEANPSHTYQTAGPRTVTLTVTDNAQQTGTDTVDINPSDVASPVEFVGGDHTNGNRASHRVTIPAGTQAGDLLVLFFSANTTNPTYGFPAGWTQAATPLNGSGILGRAWTRVATATDPGSVVTITSSAYAKSDLALGVYRGTGGVAASAAALDNATSASHTSPAVDAPAGSTWLVTYWADKSSGTTSWTAPAGQTARSSRFGSPSGAMAGLLADSAGDVSGSTGGLTATANSSTNRALSFSVVLD
jgi:PKD repeat protein